MAQSKESPEAATVLSPVSVKTPRHGAGNLTGNPRKVKDLAADFHNYIMKWEVLNSKGMEIVTKIANIKIEKVYDAQQVGDGEKRVTLPLELNPLCDSLAEVIESMAVLESKLSYKAKNAEALAALEQLHPSSNDDSTLLFNTMTLQDVAVTTKEIQYDFHKELQLKRVLLSKVAHASSREESEVLAACWLHQPYIKPQCYDLVQALLKETGHVK
ncbi:hypothetical protein EGW08_023512 [Elysia chlorotica]|uniref:Cyclin-dependent kinase 2-interacting protein n=1 Tax=Elysia chlorotica TaxID=188477 RepID=A0A3S0Z1K3_ELYCH|nr:hypothetical protein EGW08_023512 [Elysia chlorotica]